VLKGVFGKLRLQGWNSFFQTHRILANQDFHEVAF
jgi:hypothetical protein